MGGKYIQFCMFFLQNKLIIIVCVSAQIKDMWHHRIQPQVNMQPLTTVCVFISVVHIVHYNHLTIFEKYLNMKLVL